MTDAARETGTYLDRIVGTRRDRIVDELRDIGAEPRTDRIEALPGPPVDFAMRLRGSRTSVPVGLLRVIAEVKRASPSKGVFDADLDAAVQAVRYAEAQAVRYAEAGAAAVSVLTEPDHFAGSAADLVAAREVFGADPDRPALLRKDFVFDPRQIVEAREIGADAVLLIVALLEPSALRSLLDLTHGLGLQALVEVHDEGEMTAAGAAGARIIGVNNRDLPHVRGGPGHVRTPGARGAGRRGPGRRVGDQRVRRGVADGGSGGAGGPRRRSPPCAAGIYARWCVS